MTERWSDQIRNDKEKGQMWDLRWERYHWNKGDCCCRTGAREEEYQEQEVIVGSWYREERSMYALQEYQAILFW